MADLSVQQMAERSVAKMAAVTVVHLAGQKVDRWEYAMVEQTVDLRAVHLVVEMAVRMTALKADLTVFATAA